MDLECRVWPCTAQSLKSTAELQTQPCLVDGYGPMLCLTAAKDALLFNDHPDLEVIASRMCYLRWCSAHDLHLCSVQSQNVKCSSQWKLPCRDT